MHPKTKHWHLIDYITRQCDLPDFLNTRAMRGTACSTDLVIIKFTNKLQVKRRMRKDKMPIRKLATNTIKINRIRNDLWVSLNDRLAEILPVAVEEK